MVIYGDILFILNMVIDYLIIGLVLTVTRQNAKLIRQIAAAVIGGISSFYIFIESGIIAIDLAYRGVVAFIMIIIVCGIKNFKKTLKSTGIYVAFSLLLSGIAGFAADTFAAETVAFNNTYFYIGISPMLLIGFSVLFYLVSKLVIRLRRNSTDDILCTAEIELEGSNKEFTALIDSGNSLTDILTDSEVFVVKEAVLISLSGFGTEDFFKVRDNQNRCRMIPAATVSGSAVLPAVRCDRGKIAVNGKTYIFEKPIIAISPHINTGDYDVIIPKGALEGQHYET